MHAGSLESTRKASLQSRRFLRTLVENRARPPFWKQLKMDWRRGEGRGRERLDRFSGNV